MKAMKLSLLLQCFVQIIILLILPLILFANQNATSITLGQKIGQMLIVGFNGVDLTQNNPIVSDIMHQRIGGVILFDYNYQTKTFNKNIKTPKQLKRLTNQLQSYAKLAAKRNHNNFVPLLIGIDYEGGKVNRLKNSYGFSKTLSAKRLGQLPLQTSKYYANQMANTLAENKINLDFAPVLDLDSNPNNPIIGALDRSFSADPHQVIKYAGIFASAFRDKGILCVFKHFPGHGSSTTDSHKGFVDVTKTWHQDELIPYKVLLHDHKACPIVMTAHIVNRQLDSAGYPATLSHTMLTKILRKQLGFQGIIVTDDMQMRAITDNYGLEKAVKLAINAGANILVFGNQLSYDPNVSAKVIKIVKKAIKSKTISPNKIEQSYERIVQLKRSLST